MNQNMEFDRWKSQDDYSFAYRLFSGYHTYMNNMYWSYAPVFHYSRNIYRRAISENTDITTHEIFKVDRRNKDGRRVISNAKQWSHNNTEFDNWTRLNTLVAVNSYFEIYLSTIVSLALESDLGVLYSISKEVDGIKVLKYGTIDDYSFFDKSEEVTKGSWDSRISNYKKIFKYSPKVLDDNIGDLERIRKLRNKVAHSFGRDIELSRARETKQNLEIERLSLKRLQKYMGIIREVARGIDNHLLSSHIGDYENIHYYHITKDKLPDERHNKEFKRSLNSLSVRKKGWKYINTLIEYYNEL